MLGQPAAVWSECGTVACLAGHITAVAAADYPEQIRSHITPILGRSPSQLDIWSTAEAVMGMTAQEAARVFSPTISREDVLAWLDLVAAGEEPARAAQKALTWSD